MVMTPAPAALGWLDQWAADHDVTVGPVEDLPIARIDLAASLANQARLDPLHDDVVDRYTADMQAGDRFPPILVEVRADGSYVALGGNHRLAAARRAGRAHIRAITVTGPASALTLLRYEDNRRHGLPPTSEERAQVAMRLVDCDYTQAQAARAVGISQATLSKAFAVADGDARAGRLGITGYSELARDVRWRLAGIAHDTVFAAAAELVARRKLPVGEVTRLVDELRATPDEHAALAAVGEADSGPAGGRYTGGKPARTAKRRLEIALGSIAAVDVDEVLDGCETPAQRKLLNDQVMRAARRLQQVVEGLKR